MERVWDSWLQPLGRFVQWQRGEAWSALDLPRTPELKGELRARVAHYLDSCPDILSLMEYTEDQIGGQFGVPGGSALVSDGRYVWRGDSGAYVRHYGTPVPSEAVDHFEARGWVPPDFEYGSSECQRIADELARHILTIRTGATVIHPPSKST